MATFGLNERQNGIPPMVETRIKAFSRAIQPQHDPKADAYAPCSSTVFRFETIPTSACIVL